MKSWLPWGIMFVVMYLLSYLYPFFNIFRGYFTVLLNLVVEFLLFEF